ncbi:hypothetical protein CLV47_111108 [Antricoccus suffuscus]|uniref:Uncharacterized protein n=1 Tax=Antricoccus suffuscus TaxID=1629062 RepID=A0A2T0ZY08_9ACTN|nr:hypothetical protein CLV47_111108 [Antricoccus suffuscus]
MCGLSRGLRLGESAYRTEHPERRLSAGNIDVLCSAVHVSAERRGCGDSLSVAVGSYDSRAPSPGSKRAGALRDRPERTRPELTAVKRGIESGIGATLDKVAALVEGSSAFPQPLEGLWI